MILCLTMSFSKLQMTSCEKIKSEPITLPFKLNSPSQFYNLLKEVKAGHNPNATLFTKSPRNNKLRDGPSIVKIYLKMVHIEDFSEEKHELKVDVRVDYFWQDERLKTNKSLRLNYHNFKIVPEFWIPEFDFENAKVMSSTPENYVSLKNYEV